MSSNSTPSIGTFDEPPATDEQLTDEQREMLEWVQNNSDALGALAEQILHDDDDRDDEVSDS